jgi:hypothetical protein
MTAEDQTRPAIAIAHPPQRLRRGTRVLARRVLWRVARPYARRRTREAEMAGALGRLEADFEHLRERHTEQIERLEELVRELILTAESLRRAATAREDRSDS